MGAKTCFFDQADCTSMGECLACDRFPGQDKAREMVNESRAREQAARDALVKARDVTQLDPSQFAARVVTQWDEAVYGYGKTPDDALRNAEASFTERYNFAVQYHEFMSKED